MQCAEHATPRSYTQELARRVLAEAIELHDRALLDHERLLRLGHLRLRLGRGGRTLRAGRRSRIRSRIGPVLLLGSRFRLGLLGTIGCPMGRVGR